MTTEEALQLKPGQEHGTKPCLVHGLNSPGLAVRVTVFVDQEPLVETVCKHCYTESNLILVFESGFDRAKDVFVKILAIPEAKAALKARLLNRVQQENSNGD